MIALARGALAAESLPEEGAISAVTLCGLHHGVLIATEEQRPGRLATLAMAERNFVPLPVDERVAPHYGRLVAQARRRRGRRPGMGDMLIAATAAAHELPLYTRDQDFEGVPGVEVVLV